jgi:hypothetical protein
LTTSPWRSVPILRTVPPNRLNCAATQTCEKTAICKRQLEAPASSLPT